MKRLLKYLLLTAALLIAAACFRNSVAESGTLSAGMSSRAESIVPADAARDMHNLVCSAWQSDIVPSSVYGVKTVTPVRRVDTYSRFHFSLQPGETVLAGAPKRSFEVQRFCADGCSARKVLDGFYVWGFRKIII